MMKTAAITIIALLFIVSTLTNSAMAADKKQEKSVVFNVNMDCQSCVRKITDNITYEKGVKELNVSLEKKEATVTFRTDKTSTDVLIKAFNKLGYEASIVGENREVKKEEKK